MQRSIVTHREARGGRTVLAALVALMFAAPAPAQPLPGLYVTGYTTNTIFSFDPVAGTPLGGSPRGAG